MLKGRLVTLRALEPADYEVLWRWFNDAGVMLYWGRPGNTESVSEVADREQWQARRGSSRKYIIEAADARTIGQIDYYDLDWQARSTWVSIMVGDRDYWGGGYGTDAMRTLLRHLFAQLGLHRVTLTVHESNVRAQRSYEKVGFRREGLLRDWAFFDGSWHDGVIMSVLDREFVDGAP